MVQSILVFKLTRMNLNRKIVSLALGTGMSVLSGIFCSILVMALCLLCRPWRIFFAAVLLSLWAKKPDRHIDHSKSSVGKDSASDNNNDAVEDENISFGNSFHLSIIVSALSMFSRNIIITICKA